jgi:N-acetylmuramoyl-L-alanine amidase
MHKYPDIDALLKSAWDYNRRWIIACVIMGLLCAAVIPYVAWAAWKQHNRAEEATSVESDAYHELPAVDDTPAVAVSIPIPDEPPIEAALSAYLDEPPLVPLQWTAGLFCDPVNARIYLPPGVDATEIETDYLYRTHTVTISGHVPGVCSVYVGGALIDYVLIEGSSVVIRSATGSFIEYIADGGAPYLELYDPHDRYSAVIVLDPGHGGYDPGALGANGLYEKDVNLNIMFNLMEIFERGDILLLPTRTADEFVSKPARARFGNAIGDYFISIHNNADNTSSLPSGTVTFYTPNETGGRISAEEMGAIFQEELVEALGSRDRGVLGDGDFAVLNLSDIPAVIVEILFMTNEADLALLSLPETQMKIAEALRDAINRLPLRR